MIVFTISLGIAVDNTIHYILRFREEFGNDPHMERATWKTMLGKGQPMCLATFLTVIGLAVLLLSDFFPTRRFAELTIVTLSGALVGALDSVTGLRRLALETADHRQGARSGTTATVPSTPAKLTGGARGPVRSINEINTVVQLIFRLDAKGTVIAFHPGQETLTIRSGSPRLSQSRRFRQAGCLPCRRCANVRLHGSQTVHIPHVRTEEKLWRKS